MENLIGFFIFSVLMVMVKADYSEEELCVDKLLIPTFLECPVKDEKEPITIVEADRCAFEKIGLMDLDDQLHTAEYFNYLLPHLNEEYEEDKEFLEFILKNCETIASEYPPVDQYIDLAYRFTTCLWKKRNYLSIILGCHPLRINKDYS